MIYAAVDSELNDGIENYKASLVKDTAYSREKKKRIKYSHKITTPYFRVALTSLDMKPRPYYKVCLCIQRLLALLQDL